MARKFNVAVFGATGAVGREMVKVLDYRNFPINTIQLYASENSAGKRARLRNGELVAGRNGLRERNYFGTMQDLHDGGISIQSADSADMRNIDIALLAISRSWSSANAERMAEHCLVIDNSSAFRYRDDIPLVIPEVNPDAVCDARLIANPNCTTAIAALPLWQLHRNFGGLTRVSIATYQAASGAGNKGTTELREGTLAALEGRDYDYKVFQHPLAFNVIPHIDEFQENDYTREEMKVVWETRKIFGDISPRISCTCARVPVERVHSEDISIETGLPFSLEKAVNLFEAAYGIKVCDSPLDNLYPMPLTAAGKYDVEVGRIRRDLASIDPERSLKFWVSGDQLLKGAALNAVQIAEIAAGIYK